MLVSKLRLGTRKFLSPEGTTEPGRTASAVPSGLLDVSNAKPNAEALGYFQKSLRDESEILLALAAAIAVACIAGAVAVTKKLLPTKDYITRAEFHNGSDSLRDHIDAVGSSIHSRLNQLDAAITRLDERSRKCGVEQTARQHALP